MQWPSGWCSAAESPPRRPTPWLLYPFVAVGAVTLLVGQQKTAAKSSLMLSVLATMLDGAEWWFETVQAPVCYLTEDPPEIFEDLLRSARLTHHEFGYRSRVAQAWGETWPQTFARLMTAVKRMGARYVVVDTFSSWTGLSGDDENINTGAINEVMGGLSHLAVDAACGIVLIHHTRKHVHGFHDVNFIDVVRGSGAISARADLIAFVHNPAGDDLRHARRYVKGGGRIPWPDPFVVQWENGRYWHSEQPLENQSR